MNRALKITYRWRRADDGGPVVEGHEKALEEEAEEYIRKQDGQGYTSGELDAHVKMTADDPADGVHYRGWWDLDRIDEEPERRTVKKIHQAGFQRIILPKEPMRHSFDDHRLGVTATGRTISSKHATIEAPRGAQRSDWYRFAGEVTALLNQKEDELRRSKLELAENIAVHQRLMILALRKCGHVTYQEIGTATEHLVGFRDLPEDVRAEVVRIRKERWGIE